MGKKINIKIFDGFEILMDGKPILENLSNTRKTKLFVAYRANTPQSVSGLSMSVPELASPPRIRLSNR